MTQVSTLKRQSFPIECPETETKLLSKANRNVVRYQKELRVNPKTYIQPQIIIIEGQSERSQISKGAESKSQNIHPTSGTGNLRDQASFGDSSSFELGVSVFFKKNCGFSETLLVQSWTSLDNRLKISPFCVKVLTFACVRLFVFW